MRREFIITDEAGLHARPASLLVQQATKFDNEITIEHNGTKASLKSIMIVMSMGIKQGTKITIEVDGDNGIDVLDSLESVLNENNII